MKTAKIIVSWLWRLAAAGLAHAAGVVLGGALTAAVGVLELPRFPEGGEPLLLLPGGMAIALGLAAMASGIEGPRWRRWAILGAFAFVVNGVGTAIELSAFTTFGGGAHMAVANLPASLLCALVVVLLFPSAAERSGALRATFARRMPRALAARLLLALLAFPALYFLFGMMVAPIVVPYYEQFDWSVIPTLSTLLPILFLRSALFLLVSLPVITGWSRSRGALALALAVGHFTAVGLSGLLQATLFPDILRWVHGIEILATSVCYGAALAWLLFAPPATRADATGVAGRTAES